MAVLGFHFSGVYKDVLFNGKKKATIFGEPQSFREGQEVQIYLSDKPNLFDGRIEERIGKAVIVKCITKPVKDLILEEAQKCSYNTLEQLKEDLVKWYQANDDSIVTYAEFDLTLIS